MTMWSVASEPVGAPLAMSTLGAGARSLRAPATPSIVGRPWAGSKTPGWVTGPTTGCAWLQVAPPLSDVLMSSNACLPSDESVPTPNTYARPLLSVRTVQPSVGLRFRLFAAALIWCWVQVLPPSLEVATIAGAGAALGDFSCPRNDAQHT